MESDVTPMRQLAEAVEEDVVYVELIDSWYSMLDDSPSLIVDGRLQTKWRLGLNSYELQLLT